MLRLGLKRLLAAGFAPALLLLLPSCGEGRRGSATPQAAMEFSELLSSDFSEFSEGDDRLAAEVRGLLEHFSRTADARYATPERKLTMLHLACVAKKSELARCLLKDGADPNAASWQPDEKGILHPGDTPLLFAITDDGVQSSVEDINKLLDVLIEGGASLSSVQGSDGMSLLCSVAMRCAHEAVYIHLLKKGVVPQDDIIPAASQPAARGWLRALHALEQRHFLSPSAEGMSPLHAATAFIGGSGDYVGCVRYLLEVGFPPDSVDEKGRTPLFLAASFLPRLNSDEAPLTDVVDILELLLGHGADPTRTCEDEEYPGFSACDFIAMNPKVRSILQEKGFSIPAPVFTFSSGLALLSEVCKASLLEADVQTIAPSFDAIAAVLSPTPEMEKADIYADALISAIRLMARASAARTASVIEAMPLWLRSPKDEAFDSSRSAVLAALAEQEDIVLSADFLCRMAERMAAADRHDEAASLLELMGRRQRETDRLSRYLESPVPSLRAGACGALLMQAGLPAPRDGAVADWLSERGLPCDNEARRMGVLLTSLEELWYGQMPQKKQEELFSAMEAIGAKRAAEKYRAIASSLHQAEKLDAIMQDVDTWKFELEEAIGRYLLAHQGDFLPEQAENTD